MLLSIEKKYKNLKELPVVSIYSVIVGLQIFLCDMEKPEPTFHQIIS